ncbi:cytochrome o ubiquinol oxidase subunit IV [Asaia sp. As-1742]|uniref:cytochrome o ubiquinol oxidase subunit IV n=1 Tax=Asaia sp. As-1742 TaxID=2608325 RepID=UPI0014238531|nr:cytochrome o ubiquinol oxidase subunit IV [Asaia sp. As-1742]NIE80471.1 cytochrome o ubiquinol oxidase subunit IV [Asaia sp. As-1742]
MSDRHAQERRQELHGYIIGLVLALLLSAIPFVGVMLGLLPRPSLIWIIALLGLAQVVVHFRFFLHIDLSRSHRDDLQLVLFSLLIVILMVGGTLWVLGNQRHMMG